MRGTLARLVCGAALIASWPVAAQDVSLPSRVDRLEREMRAVQRKVFGTTAAGGLVEPDIGPAKPATPDSGPGAPADTPLADLTARVAALEAQMQRMTGQIEDNQHRLQQLEEAFTAYKKDMDSRLGTLRANGPPPAEDGGGGGGAIDAPAPRRSPQPTPTATPTPKSSDTGPGVTRPDTGDAVEDAYMYGYKLWQAKRYADAETQLKAFVAKYPKQRRASFAQNLLGRAYLDDGKPSLAAIAFYDNYRNMPEGERAPDSLLYLAQALVQLKKPASEVCKVYGELDDVYGKKLSAAQLAELKKGRAANQCK